MAEPQRGGDKSQKIKKGTEKDIFTGDVPSRPLPERLNLERLQKTIAEEPLPKVV